MKEKMLKRFNHDSDSPDKKIVPPLPTSLNIELTSACNHKCFFCNYHSDYLKEKVKSEFMDLNLCEKLICEASELGIGSEEIGFHMTGEPMLFKEFKRIIKLAKDKGFKYIFTTTNGSLAEPETMIELIEAGLDSVRFSVNGATRQSYLFAHGKDDFEKVLKNIQFLDKYRRENGKKIHVSLSMVITKKNLQEREEMDHIFGELVDEIAYIPVLGLDRFIPEIAEEYSFQETGEAIYAPCATVFNSLYISCEGFVVPCCAAIKNEQMIIADVKGTENLQQIWGNQKFQQMRENFLKGQLPNHFCEGCIAINGNHKMLME